MAATVYSAASKAQATLREAIALPLWQNPDQYAHVERIKAFQSIQYLTRKYIDEANPSNVQDIRSFKSWLLQSRKSLTTEEVAEFTSDILHCLRASADITADDISLARTVLEQLSASMQDAQQRRLLSALGVAYMQIGDYSQACKFLLEACKVAIKLDDPLYYQATLANFVAVVEEMGCLQDAKRLAIELAHLPVGSPECALLQIQNSANGLRLCYETNDLQSSDIFFAKATEAFSISPPPDNHTIVGFEVGKILRLLQTNDYAGAESTLANLRETYGNDPNVKVRSMICSTRVELAALSGKSIQVEDELFSLLESTAGLPFYRNLLSEALVKNLAMQGSRKADERAYAHALEMRSYNIKLRVSQFLLLSTECVNQFGSGALLDPSLWSLRRDFALSHEFPGFDVQHNNDQLDRVARIVNSVGQRLSNIRTVSADGTVAENWAIAAELFTGGSGSQYQRVERFARELGSELGMKFEEASLLGKQCTLYNVGMLFCPYVVDTNQDRWRVFPCLIYDHVVAGELFLSRSSDPDVAQAASIARHHHEWWNGRGLPDGLSGEDIPLAARVCACVVSFVELSEECPDWDDGALLDQLDCISGVQLDPHLVCLFRRVVERPRW